MDLAVLFLSVEVTKRSAGSALPGAEVVPPSRWERVSAALRARLHPPETGGGGPAVIVPPYDVGIDAPTEAGWQAATEAGRETATEAGRETATDAGGAAATTPPESRDA
jgi:hypothetical protein